MFGILFGKEKSLKDENKEDEKSDKAPATEFSPKSGMLTNFDDPMRAAHVAALQRRRMHASNKIDSIVKHSK